MKDSLVNYMKDGMMTVKKSRKWFHLQNQFLAAKIRVNQRHSSFRNFHIFSWIHIFSSTLYAEISEHAEEGRLVFMSEVCIFNKSLEGAL